MTVYVVSEPMSFDRAANTYHSKFDFSAAEQYGDVKILLSFQAKPWDKTVVDELKEKLKDFGDGDWIILTGNPALMGAAAAIVADLCEGTLRVLQYHGKEGRYVPVVMDVFS